MKIQILKSDDKQMEEEVKIDIDDEIYDSEALSTETKYELDKAMHTNPYPARSSEERETYRPWSKSKAKKRPKRAIAFKSEEERKADIIFKNR